MIMHLVNIKIVGFEVQALQRIASILDRLFCSCANHFEMDVLEEDDTILLDKSLGNLGHNMNTERLINGTKQELVHHIRLVDGQFVGIDVRLICHCSIVWICGWCRFCCCS